MRLFDPIDGKRRDHCSSVEVIVEKIVEVYNRILSDQLVLDDFHIQEQIPDE